MNMLLVALLGTAPAFGGLSPAMVVVEEDFEDDIVDESTFFNFAMVNGAPEPDPFFDGTVPERGLGFNQNQTGHINHLSPDVGPSNPVSRPGRWIPNQYPVGSPTEDGMGYQGGQWFDNLDMFPDTDWQTAVVTDFRQMSINTAAPPRQGNEGFIINHHQGDCSAADPCDNPDMAAAFRSHKMAREGFIAFTDGAGNDVAAQAGDVIRGKILIAPTEGVPVLGLTNDIQGLADSTGLVEVDINGDGVVEAISGDHAPLSKWTVGFGQPFNPIDSGISAWQARAIQPEILSVIGYPIGFNQTYHMTWKALSAEDLAGCVDAGGVCSTQVPLTPDHDVCSGVQAAMGRCEPAFTDPATSPFARAVDTDPFLRYTELEFQYTVGETTYDLLKLAGIDVMACDGPNASKPCDDPDNPAVPTAGNVPITRPGDKVDGFFVGTSGPKNGNSFFFDDICITINQTLDACNLTQGNGGPQPLVGDANGDNQVTGGDLISVQQNFGKTGPDDGSLPGDANIDGLVTGADLIAVQQNFGKVQMAPVPEPAIVGLLAAGVLGLLRRRA